MFSEGRSLAWERQEKPFLPTPNHMTVASVVKKGKYTVVKIQ